MQTDEAPSVVDGVIGDCRRLVRLLGGLLLVGILGALAVVVALAPLWVAAIFTLLLIFLIRFPLFGTTSSMRLETDDTPVAVRSAFQGPRPPGLPFQWGLADSVESTETGARYRFSSLFGFSETVMETEFRSVSEDDFELVVTLEGKAWGTYQVSLDREGTTTVLDVRVTADRWFGLRRLPQFVAANRFRSAALEAQGYTVSESDRSLRLVGTGTEG